MHHGPSPGVKATYVTLLRGGGVQRGADAIPPTPICYLSDTDIVRASERQHSVQRSGSDGNLGHLGLAGARSKRIADYALVSADRCLDLGPQIVAAGFLPGHAAAFDGHPQVAVALCRGGPGRSARHRTCPR